MPVHAKQWTPAQLYLADSTQSVTLEHSGGADIHYIPHALSVPQFTTLYAIVKRTISRLHGALVAPGRVATGLDASLVSEGGLTAPVNSEIYPLGLDALDELSRGSAGFPFAELTPELQDIMLDMIASGQLTTGRLNLAGWLEELLTHVAETARRQAAA